MFDVKKHQPIFRNIILTGNERKTRKKRVKKSEKDTDSAAVSSDDLKIEPVLNIHRLH